MLVVLCVEIKPFASRRRALSQFLVRRKLSMPETDNQETVSFESAKSKFGENSKDFITCMIKALYMLIQKASFSLWLSSVGFTLASLSTRFL